MEIMAAISSLANYTRIKEAWVRKLYERRRRAKKEGSRGNWEVKFELLFGFDKDLPVCPLRSQKSWLLVTTRNLGEGAGGWWVGKGSKRELTTRMAAATPANVAVSASLLILCAALEESVRIPRFRVLVNIGIQVDIIEQVDLYIHIQAEIMAGVISTLLLALTFLFFSSYLVQSFGLIFSRPRHGHGPGGGGG